MSFGDIGFIFVFLPLTWVLYYILPKKCRNAVFFVAGAVFYCVGSLDAPISWALLAVSLLLNFLFGIAVGKTKRQRKRKFALALGVIYNVAALVLFKYTDFIVSVFGLDGVGLASHGILMPIGISFYTFRAISYLVDVYRKDCPYAVDFIGFGAYFCGFTHMTAGPIVRWRNFAPQLQERRYSIDNFLNGIRLFFLGLGLKVILANNIYGLWNHASNIGFDSLSPMMAWLAAIAYSFYIYFDFFGYSVMALGLAATFGF